MSTTCDSLRFTWNTPNSNGSPLQRYEINLQTKNGAYNSIRNLCPAANINANNNNFGNGASSLQNSCDIPLNSLSAWNFQSGDGVQAQIRACNTLCSTPTISNRSVLPAAPNAISRPIETSRNGGNIQISWNSVAS